jgi:hypothetical protein
VSIIYNALQKAQQNRQNETKKKSRATPWLDRILISVAAVLFAVGTYSSISDRIEHVKHADTTATKQTVAAPIALAAPAVAVAASVTPKLPAPAEVAEIAQATPETSHNMNPTDYKSSHVLGGVYLSNEEKIALINNKFFHLGDTVDGMKLVSIEANRIILRYADNALILQTDQS